MQSRRIGFLASAALVCAAAGWMAASNVTAGVTESQAPQAAVPMMLPAVDTTTGDFVDLALTPVVPVRILDTRAGAADLGGTDVPWGPKETRTVVVAGLGPIPATAKGVVLNVTAVLATEVSYVTIYPSGTSLPNASTMNPVPNEIAFNSATMLLGSDGNLSVYNDVGSVDLIIDVTGYFTEELKAQVDKVNLGDIEAPFQYFGGGYDQQWSEWNNTLFHPPLLAGILLGVPISEDRYSTMQLEFVVQGTEPPANACFRIASDVGGPIASSEICVDPNNDPLFGPDGNGLTYWKYVSPRVAVPSGSVYLEVKVEQGSIELSRYYFRFFG